MGYFISVLRDRIATFHSQGGDAAVDGISINDLRKNLSIINQFMEVACKKTAARYGIELEAALITTIDPPATSTTPWRRSTPPRTRSRPRSASPGPTPTRSLRWPAGRADR